MIYPAITDLARKQKSINEQLQDEAKTRPQSLAARPLFKIHFRIVTRGNNPNLVLSNCQDSLQVLQSSGLPVSRYQIEIATDKRMDTITQVPQVEQLVVPHGYKPPGGCKYKARALNYAANASPAGARSASGSMGAAGRRRREGSLHVRGYCRSLRFMHARKRLSRVSACHHHPTQ